eukprot:365126-Chlamydomonas_euryale.AAC.30
MTSAAGGSVACSGPDRPVLYRFLPLSLLLRAEARSLAWLNLLARRSTCDEESRAGSVPACARNAALACGRWAFADARASHGWRRAACAVSLAPGSLHSSMLISSCKNEP